MQSPPLSKRRRSRENSSEQLRRRPSSNGETLTATSTTDEVARRTSKRSRRARSSRSASTSGQNENSVTSSTTLNTAFIDTDSVPDSNFKWRPDISAILPDDVIKRVTGSGVRKPEVVVAVGRQMSLCERKFVDDVSDVVCRLLRPLLRRHDIVTSRQHAVLFQNLEKVCCCR